MGKPVGADRKQSWAEKSILAEKRRAVNHRVKEVNVA
jgi:hypothetical protein